MTITSPDHELLFAGPYVSDYFGERVRQAKQEMELLRDDQVLDADSNGLAALITDKYSVEPICLQVERIEIVGTGKTNINLGDAGALRWLNYGGPATVPGTFVEYAIPFTGDARLFEFKPTRSVLNFPQATVKQQELRIQFQTCDHDDQTIKKEFHATRSLLEKCVRNMAADVEDFNRTLPSNVAAFFDERQRNVRKHKGMIESLGYPLRRRPGAEATFSAPIRRKTIALPETKKLTAKQEPRLEITIYEDILKTIGNMGLVVERSPSAFRDIAEEVLRFHILIQLNAQYEGAATGETFNGNGKTDILIRWHGKNIFIAECKFWGGPKMFTDCLDQLLGYTTWRDAKTAIVIFNRKKNTSAVLKKIPEVAKLHPQFVRELTGQPEGRHRFVFEQKDDPEKHILLTVLVFDVPQ